MCGIAGFIAREADPAALPRMLREIAHRGPDGEGAWRGAAGGADWIPGRWRWDIAGWPSSIVAGGVQPMGNEDGKVVLTYNGEVYNFRALRAPLEQQGHRFRTRSDTETIIHHYEQHGAGGVAALRGDVRLRHLGRRRRAAAAGARSLRHQAALLRRAAVGRAGLRLRADGVAGARGRRSGAGGRGAGVVLLLRLRPSAAHAGRRGEEAAARGTRSAGSAAGWRRRVRFGRCLPPVRRRRRAATQLGRRLWAGIERSVEAQLVSDVPVGIFLSGGIDSSLVAAAAVKRAGARMKAFSIGFEDGTFDETNYARMVAKQLGVEHVTETLSEANLLDVVDDALDRLDEPLANPSFIPTFLLSRLAARHVKVVVGGDGGDELWGGYPTYRAHRLAARLRRASRLVPARDRRAGRRPSCQSTIATRAWSGSCAALSAAGTTPASSGTCAGCRASISPSSALAVPAARGLRAGHARRAAASRR